MIHKPCTTVVKPAQNFYRGPEVLTLGEH